MSNFSWKPFGLSGPPELALNITEVLYGDPAEPRIFTSDWHGLQLLWYLCDQTKSHQRFLAVPTSARIVALLKTGANSVSETLSVPGLLVVETDYEMAVKSSWNTSIDLIPQEVLPQRGVLLWPSLRPVFSVRYTGPTLSAGLVPASTLKRAVDSSYLALKKLADAAVGSTPGRPTRGRSRFFDLPTQRFAFGSIELSFAKPRDDQGQLLEEHGPDATWKLMGEMLCDGLEWSKTGIEQRTPARSVLEAIEKLCPFSDIENVHVGGTLLGSRKAFNLTQLSSKVVKAALRRTETALESLDEKGFVREFDKDRRSFILRDAAGQDLATVASSEDLYDQVLEAFTNERPVHVLGWRRLGRNDYELSALTEAKVDD